MKFILAMLKVGNSKETIQRFMRFQEGQKMKRRFESQLRELEKQKPVYKVPKY